MTGERAVYGFHPVRELLRRAPHAVVRLWIAARPGKRRSEIEALCRRHRIVPETVSRQRLDALAESPSHNGFGARYRPRPSTPDRAGDPELHVLVEDIQDPRNLGALMRVCEGAGVGRMLIRDRGSAPISPVAVKASAGAAEWLPIERIVNPARRIAALKKEGFWIYGTDPAGDPLWQADLRGKILLCFGGERAGLRALTRKSCDRLISLPMRGRLESLNVATAAAAVLYEALRQRIRQDAASGTAGG